MIFHVYKKKRTRKGKTTLDRLYRGRYRLDGEYAVTEVSLNTPDKQVAAQRLRTIVYEKERERDGLIAPKLERESAKGPLKEHLEEFVADLAVKGRSEHYYCLIRTRVTILSGECGWKSLSDIRPDDFVRWRTKQAHAPKTLNEYLNAMNTFLNWMVKQARIAENPLIRVEKVDIRGRQQKRRAMTDKEFERLLAVSEDYRLFYLTAVYTGLRLGELQGMIWSEVKVKDEENPRIVIPANRTKNRQEAVLPLHSKLAEYLSEASENAKRSDLVFPQYVNPSRRFRRHLKEAGIPVIDETGRKLDFHSLRYTFATRLAKKGVSQRLAQELMRHSDPKLTANLYTDVNQLPTFGAVNSLDWFEGEEAKTCGSQIGPQNAVSASQKLSCTGKDVAPKRSLQSIGNEILRLQLSLFDTKGQMVGLAGFEPTTSTPPV